MHRPISNPREQSLRYPLIPHARFQSFSGHEPHNLRHNISRTASNALPPPFKNGFYLPQASGRATLTEVEDPGMHSIPRKPNRAEVIGESACFTGPMPRYDSYPEANLDQQRSGTWPCGKNDRMIVQGTTDQSHDKQWEAAATAWSPAAGVRLEAPAVSGCCFLETKQSPDRGIAADNWHATWEPIRQAPTASPGASPSISSEEGEPRPKKRKTTNTEPPPHPPADAIYQHPPEVLSIVAHIKSLPRKRGNQGYPMSTKLRSVPGMNRRIGFISKSSPLMSWYGDTRLFTAKWWMWLYVGGKARKELERELGESDEVDRSEEL